MDEIDKFRNAVLDKIIESERLKEQQTLAKQRMCHHHYDVIGSMYPHRYQQRECSKCGHSAIKRLEMWDKNCVIS